MNAPRTNSLGEQRTSLSQPNNILTPISERASPAGPETDESLAAHSEHAKAAYAARLARLAEYLPAADRQLLRSVYAHGRSVADVATLLDVPTESLRRRVRRLVARVSRPEFAFVALRRREWTPSLRAVAGACVLEGKSMRIAARELTMSMHNVRTLRERALAMARGAQETRAMLSAENRAADRRWRDTRGD